VLKRSSLLIVGVLSLALLVSACSKPTPEERVTEARSKYVALLNGFVVQQRPIESAPEGPMAEAVEGGAESEAAEVESPGDEGGESWEEAVDLSQDVLLDIVIRHDSFEKLDWLTVDITMADGEQELETWRAWFETGGIEKGPGVQFSHTLENIDYQPGFGFSAEVRTWVPPEDRAEYKEYLGIDE
jgi:hypothetical protein